MIQAITAPILISMTCLVMALPPKTIGNSGGGGKAKQVRSSTPTITVRTQSEVPSAAFTLGEVATIEGGSAALVNKLKAVSLGSSPIPGSSRLMVAGDVTVKLLGGGIDPKTVTLNVPSQFTVNRAKSDVRGEQIIAAAKEAARPKLAAYPDATLIAKPIGDTFALPMGVIAIETGDVRGSVESGTLFVQVSVKSNGKVAQTLDISLQVKRKSRVVITNRSIEQNEILSADDVSLAYVDLPSNFTGELASTKLAVGKRVKKRIASDQPISSSMIEIPNLINANDPVTLQCSIGVVGLSVPGIAKKAGVAGDLIKVYLSDTRKEVDAIIVDKHTVRLPEIAE